MSGRRFKSKSVCRSHPLHSSPNKLISTAAAVQHSCVQVKQRLLLDTVYYETWEHKRLDNHLCFVTSLIILLPIDVTWAFFGFKPFMVLSGLSAFPLHLCHSRTLHNLKLHIFPSYTSGVGVIYTHATIYSISLICRDSALS